MHPSDEDLESYYWHRLPSEQIPAIESHVLICGLCLDKLLSFTQPPPVSGKQAKEARGRASFSIGADLSIRVFDRTNQRLTGKVLDFSKNVLRIKLTESLHPGLWVQAHIDTRIIMAMVRYCVPHAQEFHVSLEINNIFLIPARGNE